MLTQYGKLIRKHRIDKSMTLREMANDLNVTPSFLSATETGRRPVPHDLLNKISRPLDLDMTERAELARASEISRQELKVRFGENASNGDREIAAMFARRFHELSEPEKEEMRRILEGRRK